MEQLNGQKTTLEQQLEKEADDIVSQADKNANSLKEADMQSNSSQLQSIVDNYKEQEKSPAVVAILSTVDSVFGTNYALPKTQQEANKKLDVLSGKISNYKEKDGLYQQQERKLEKQLFAVEKNVLSYMRKLDEKKESIEKKQNHVKVWTSRIENKQYTGTKKFFAEDKIKSTNLEIKSDLQKLKIIESGYVASKRTYDFAQAKLFDISAQRMNYSTLFEGLETVHAVLKSEWEQAALALDFKGVAQTEVDVRSSLEEIADINTSRQKFKEERMMYERSADSLIQGFEKITQSTYDIMGF